MGGGRVGAGAQAVSGQGATFDPAEVIAAWAGDPVAFVRQAFGAEPEPWQAKALAAVVTEDRIAIRSGHGVGKTAFLAWVLLWWLLTRYPAHILFSRRLVFLFVSFFIFIKLYSNCYNPKTF